MVVDDQSYYYSLIMSTHPRDSELSQLLERAEELNLQYKTKIIELENELNHEKIRAKEYEAKFKDAVLQSQFAEEQDLLEKLTAKEKELNESRKQVLELNRRLANSTHAPAQTDLMALARQNEELMDSIEQIKSAAISAIMAKEEQLEELQKVAEQYEVAEAELRNQYEKYEQLERECEVALREKEGEIEELNERMAREREHLLNKILAIQKEASQEEFSKERLLEKTFQLEGTVEKSETIILDYESKIIELQNQAVLQKLTFDKEKALLQMEAEAAKEDLKMADRDNKAFLKAIEEVRTKERETKETLKKAIQTNEELAYKLTMKKKKENKVLKDKITSSFAGMAKHNPVYASFAFRQKDSIIDETEEGDPKHLGDYPELQEIDGFIENFSFEELGREKKQEIKQHSHEPLSNIMKKKSPDQEVPVEGHPQNASEADTLKPAILRLQTEKKELQGLLNQAYNEIEGLNQKVQGLTGQLQAERAGMAELRQQLKKSKRESELIVELQSLTLHIEKLQMDMVASKLKYAQQAEFVRQKYNREKIMWTQKLVQLTDKIAKQDLLIQSKGEEKKKKKGFFS